MDFKQVPILDNPTFSLDNYLDDSEPVSRDLFGEPVTTANVRRRSKIVVAGTLEKNSSLEEIATVSPAVRLRFPARFLVEGSVYGNPLRQIALDLHP
ncbi:MULTISPECIES: hypothetical protein [unclassified Afipia]|uniref:hypothetical protein n=1 Tax=unclassified Afipia TaxID=2642050 RepID=UPI0012689C32|nr:MULTISPECIES: hypothetical protein [unclassified Afipia]